MSGALIRPRSLPRLEAERTAACRQHVDRLRLTTCTGQPPPGRRWRGPQSGTSFRVLRRCFQLVDVRIDGPLLVPLRLDYEVEAGTRVPATGARPCARQAGGASMTRPVSSPHAQRSISGGVTPSSDRAVQT